MMLTLAALIWCYVSLVGLGYILNRILYGLTPFAYPNDDVKCNREEIDDSTMLCLLPLVQVVYIIALLFFLLVYCIQCIINFTSVM